MSNSSIHSAKELADLQDLMATTFGNLLQLWTKYGHKEDILAKRKFKLVHNIKELCEDMINQEKIKDCEMSKTIAGKVEEITELSRQLSLTPEVGGYGPTCTKTLLDQNMELTARLEGLVAQKKVRMARYDYLRQQEKIICDELEEPIAEIAFDGIPHDNQVDELDRIVKKWKNEKITRTTTIEKLQSSIDSLFTALEKTPVSSIEKMAMSKATPALTAKNIEDMTSLQAELEKLFEKNRSEAEGLRKRIRDLWNRLATPVQETQDFEEHHSGCKPSVIVELKKQLQLLEEEKMRNIERFTMEIRKEIIEIWDKCFVSQGIRLRFADMKASNFTEELLDSHEKEVSKWKEYYESNKQMIELVSEWRRDWNSWVQLEEMDDDPVLIANRGGARLKHEKAKKELQKILTKLEKEIKHLNEDHLVSRGEHFSVGGMAIQEYIGEQKNLAELERQERKNQKKRQAEETRAQAPGNRKRGLPLTPSSKVLGAMKKSKFAAPAAPGGTFVRTPAEKQGVPIRGGNNTKFIPPKGAQIDLISPASTYSEFTNHLIQSNAALSSSVCQPLALQNNANPRGHKPALQLAKNRLEDVQNQF